MSEGTVAVRADQDAHDQEWDRLLQRWRELAPHDRCFCGSLDDLRYVVAYLEARHERDSRHTSPARRAPSARRSLEASRVIEDEEPEL